MNPGVLATSANLFLVVTMMVVGCSRGPEADDPATTGSRPAPVPPEQLKPDKKETIHRAAYLWNEIAGYRKWSAASDAPVRGHAPHGAWTETFFNDTVAGAIGKDGPWPDGSILVKDNYTPKEDNGDGPGEVMIVTVMRKTRGEWFWAKYAPTGVLHVTSSHHPTPNEPIAGTVGVDCIPCHQGAQNRDMVITVLSK